MDNQHLHERDFYAWASEQAELLRAGRLSEADIGHIADEIESMGKSEKRELVDRLTVLLLHLLKWQCQPSHRGASWRASIDNARDDIGDHLDDNPSLTSKLAEAVAAGFRRARRQATAETGFDDATFPQSCPWSYDQFIDPGFWPDRS